MHFILQKSYKIYSRQHRVWNNFWITLNILLAIIYWEKLFPNSFILEISRTFWYCMGILHFVNTMANGCTSTNTLLFLFNAEHNGRREWERECNGRPRLSSLRRGCVGEDPHFIPLTIRSRRIGERGEIKKLRGRLYWIYAIQYVAVGGAFRGSAFQVL